MMVSKRRLRFCGECLVFKTRFCRQAYLGQDLTLCTDNAEACDHFVPLKDRYLRYLRDLRKMRARASLSTKGGGDG
jgi:hypothetical protein